MPTPNYFITGVWKNDQKEIVNVLIHTNTATGFNTGIRVPVSDVISAINSGSTVMTLRWNYRTAAWSRGAYVQVVRNAGSVFLRTVADATEEDNLDNMILMNNLIKGI